MKRTVAIVGRAKETRDQAPFDDPAVDIWMMNDYAMRAGRRVSCHFEMHSDWHDTDRYEPDYKRWLLEDHGFPVLMHDEDPRVPFAVRYPIEKVREEFGGYLWKGEEQIRDFISSSTPYALALAILNFQRIELYGIELYDNGYRHQGDSIFYWIGQANARGVDVVIHPNSRLYSSQLYPR